MTNETEPPVLPPWIAPLTGYRTIITGCTMAVFNFLDAFDIIHLTDKQTASTNRLLVALAVIFMALKAGRIHRSIDAAAQTTASTAVEVGAAVTPDPEAKPAEPAP